MKRILNQFLFAAALVCGAMSVSSCQGLIDAVLGEHVDNPTQPTTTPKDPSTNPAAAAKATDLLADAQKEGATVVFWFTYEDEVYRAVFKKVGDDYVLQNGDAASTRAAGTRSWEELGKGGIKDLKDKLRGSMKIVKPKSVETMRLTIITPKGEGVLQMDVNCATGAASQVTANAKTYVDAVATLAAGASITVENVEEVLGKLELGGEADLSILGCAMIPDASVNGDITMVSGGDLKTEADAQGKTLGETLKDKTDDYENRINNGANYGGSGGGVNAGSRFRPDEITLDPRNIYLNVKESKQLTATIKPSNADQTVKWTSDDESVATVDQNGVVTAVGGGSTTINAEAPGAGIEPAFCSVTVKAATVPVTGVTLNNSTLELTAGDTFTLKATVAPENASNKDVTWESNNTAAATVDSEGKVTAVAAGEATITVTTKDGGKPATCTVTVKAKAVPVTGVTLDQTSLDLTAGDTKTLTATIAPADADIKSVTWKSNNTAAATVDSEGKVTAVAAGEAKITVTTTDGGFTADCNVVVKAATVSVTGVSLNKSKLNLNAGDTETLTATVAPTDASNKAVTWNSNKESVATVDSEGKVKAIAAGEATITVTTTDGSFTADCKVTVKNAFTIDQTGYTEGGDPTK